MSAERQRVPMDFKGFVISELNTQEFSSMVEGLKEPPTKIEYGSFDLIVGMSGDGKIVMLVNGAEDRHSLLTFFDQ